MARPVRCNSWILFMASLGWVKACPRCGTRDREGVTSRPSTETGLRPHPPREPRTMMRFYDGQHGFYAGIDLHARRLHLCVLDAKGQVVKDVNIAATPDAFLAAIAPFNAHLAALLGLLLLPALGPGACAQEQAGRL